MSRDRAGQLVLTAVCDISRRSNPESSPRMEAIEYGAADYQIRSPVSGTRSSLPVNAISRNRGVNILCLWAQATEKGYSSNLSAAFNQGCKKFEVDATKIEQ